MNKRNILSAITISVLALLATSTAVAQNGNCAPANVKLVVDTYHLWLNDKQPICVVKGAYFYIGIKQPGNSTVNIEKGDVTVAAKDPGIVTIDGDNHDLADLIAIKVGDNAVAGNDYKFWIKVEGVGELDPRVRVVDSNTMLMLRQVRYNAAVDLLLDALNMPIEEFNILHRDFGKE